jgi:hypothetical protein
MKAMGQQYLGNPRAFLRPALALRAEAPASDVSRSLLGVE